MNIHAISRVSIQQRISDIDRLGHVNNSVLAQYFDVGRLDYLQEKLPPVSFDDQTWVLVRLELDFSSSCLMGETLYVYSALEHIGTKSIRMIQELRTDTGELRSRCRSVLSTLDRSTNTAFIISDSWRAVLESRLISMDDVHSYIHSDLSENK